MNSDNNLEYKKKKTKIDVGVFFRFNCDSGNSAVLVAK